MLESTSVTELNKSSSVNNIYYIQTPSIKLITYLVYLSNLVVEPHGSLAHIASMFNKKTIDLIYPEYINYLKKWRLLGVFKWAGTLLIKPVEKLLLKNRAPMFFLDFYRLYHFSVS